MCLCTMGGKACHPEGVLSNAPDMEGPVSSFPGFPISDFGNDTLRIQHSNLLSFDQERVPDRAYNPLIAKRLLGNHSSISSRENPKTRRKSQK